jgi:hypothetical protein
MPNAKLWVGIPLLALTLAAGAYVVQANHHAPKSAASTGATKLTADVMDTAKESCCATQDSSTITTASATTQLTGASSQPNDGKAIVESNHADKGSCEPTASGANGNCPVDKTQATRTKLAQSDGVQQQAVCPAAGATPAIASPKTEPMAKPVPKAKTTIVAEMKVATATK